MNTFFQQIKDHIQQSVIYSSVNWVMLEVQFEPMVQMNKKIEQNVM